MIVSDEILQCSTMLTIHFWLNSQSGLQALASLSNGVVIDRLLLGTVALEPRVPGSLYFPPASQLADIALLKSLKKFQAALRIIWLWGFESLRK